MSTFPLETIALTGAAQSPQALAADDAEEMFVDLSTFVKPRAQSAAGGRHELKLDLDGISIRVRSERPLGGEILLKLAEIFK